MGQGIQHTTFYGYSNVFPLRHPEWDDIRVSVNNLRVPSVNNPSWISFRGTQILSFSDQGVEGNEEIVYFAVQLPHAWKIGTPLKPHIHWMGEDDTAGNTAWKMTYCWGDVDEACPSEVSETIIDANKTDAVDIMNIAPFSDIDATGKTLSGMLLCSLRRNSSNALDTYNGKNARLLEVDFHFQMDTLGSQEQFDKN